MSSRASLRVRVVSTSVIQSVVLGKVITAGSVKPDGPLWRRITRLRENINKPIESRSQPDHIIRLNVLYNNSIS